MCDGRHVLCYNPYNVAVNITVFISRMNVVGLQMEGNSVHSLWQYSN